MAVNFAGTPVAGIDKMVSGAWDAYSNAQKQKQQKEYLDQQKLALQQDTELKQKKFQAEQEDNKQSMELYNRYYGNGQASTFNGASNGQYANTGSAPAAFKTEDPISQNLNAPDKALLNGIAGGESAGKYNIRYTPQGGATFEGYDKHPGIREAGPHGPSTAAGRYQFTQTTWNDVMGADTPFTPENQDLAARKLAYRDYQARTGRDLGADLQQEGFSPRIQQALAPTWVALKGNNDRHSATYQQSLSRYSKPQVAENEQQAQVLDQQMMARQDAQQSGFQPSMVAQADLPAPGAQEVQFQPPGAQQEDSQQQQPFTNPADGSSKRLAELRALMAHPKMKDNMKSALKLEHDLIVDNLKQPDAVKQYLFAKSEGFSGGFAAWKKLNPNGTVVNVGGDGDKYKDELDKGKAARVTALWKAGDGAPEILNSLDVIESAVRNPNVMTGLGGDALLSAQKGMQSIGRLFGIEYSPDSIKDGESIAKESRQLVAKMAKSAVGARVTNFEFDQFLKANPGLETSPEGNLKLISIMRQKAQRDMALAEIADEHDGTHRELQRKIRDYDKAHPLLNPDDGKQLRSDSVLSAGGGQQQGGQAPQQQQQSQQQYPDGRRQAADGNFYVPDPSRPGKYLQVR